MDSRPFSYYFLKGLGPESFGRVKVGDEKVHLHMKDGLFKCGEADQNNWAFNDGKGTNSATMVFVFR